MQELLTRASFTKESKRICWIVPRVPKTIQSFKGLNWTTAGDFWQDLEVSESCVVWAACRSLYTPAKEVKGATASWALKDAATFLHWLCRDYTMVIFSLLRIFLRSNKYYFTASLVTFLGIGVTALYWHKSPSVANGFWVSFPDFSEYRRLWNNGLIYRERTQLSKLSLFKSGVGPNLSSHASPAARNSAFLFYFILPSWSSQLHFPNSLPTKSNVCCIKSDIYVWFDQVCLAITWPSRLTGRYIFGSINLLGGRSYLSWRFSHL